MFNKVMSFADREETLSYSDIVDTIRWHAATGQTKFYFGRQEISQTSVNRLISEDLDITLKRRKARSLFKPTIDDSYYIVSWGER